MTFRSVAPRCPACTALLEERTLFEMHTLQCVGCGSAWFEELDRDALARTEGEAAGTCPRCERTLRAAVLAGSAAAPALACDACRGVFVPAASFTSLLEEPRAGTMPPPRPDHVRMLAVVRALARWKENTV